MAEKQTCLPLEIPPSELPQPQQEHNDDDSKIGPEGDEEQQYSVFRPLEKKLITAVIGSSMIFSPLTANIYFPGLVQIQKDLAVTPQMVDLTITSYLVVQGVSPVLFGDAADVFGRRPVFVTMFSVYAALLVLRMLQSLGCSATIAIAYGVIADVSTPAERGGMQGVAITAANVGPVLAPVIGAALVSNAGWHWVFWFLLIAGAVVLLLILLFLLETARNVVGNGSTLPPGWRRPLVSTVFGVRFPRAGRPLKVEVMPKRTSRVLNPLRSFRILFYKDAFFVLLSSGVFYLIYYCVQASITNELEEIYGLHDSVIGACYLAIGVGVIIGGFVNGKLMNYNYKRQCREMGHQTDKVKGDDLKKFPIERARIKSMAYFNIAHLAALAVYGWLLQKRVHVSGPLIIQFVLGGLETCIVQTFNTLPVDIFQDTPSTAAGIAGMKPLMNRIGNGWYFTMLSLIGFAVGSVGTFVLHRYGMKWRLERSQ
ncbi:chloramphenicol resistance protein [Xylariaceae sp. FL0594]|nr:chloramphenicol resistance protein [Xylariaceae sp. FL0594]